MRPLSLRHRITAGLLLYAALLSAAVLGASVVLNEQHERLVWRGLLTDVLERDLKAAGWRGGDVGTPNSVRLLDLDSALATGLPPTVRRLGPGLYDDIEPGNLGYAVLVRKINGRRMAALVDISAQRTQERRLAELLALTTIVGLASLLLATWWLAGRLLRPVSELVHSVHTLDPSRRNARVGTSFHQREILALEEAFNEFLKRLDGFVLREREFVDTASHELRTPIAVIACAAEVLQSESLSHGGRSALTHIRHTAVEMEDLLGVLLHLTKEPAAPTTVELLALDIWLPELAQDYRLLLEGKPLTLEMGPLESTQVRVAPVVATMVIGNLLRNAIEHTPTGQLHIALSGGVLTIESRGEPLDPAAIARLYRAMAMADGERATGGGIGLYLIQRLCERVGWTLAYEQGDSGALRARLDLRTASGATP